MTLKIAVTGGIACGKTAATAVFASLGVKVIDCDVISRQVAAPGTEVLNKIFEHFGPGVKNPDGSLNRAQLRAIVFADDNELNFLNALMHGAIRQKLEEEIRQCEGKEHYIVLAIPLLFENHLEHLADRILVLNASEDTQVRRIIRRDGCSKETALGIIAKQVSAEYRIEHADDLIHTDYLEPGGLTAKIVKLHKLYSAM